MPAIRTFVGFVCATAFCASLHAQTDSVIHIRLLDGKTGLPVEASNFLVRINRHETVRNELVRMNDDGSVVVTVPAGAQEIAIKPTYDLAMETYINCDAARETGKERDIWYSISTILQTGVVAPNECSETHYTAKPGEFIFFVRKRSWRDAPQD